MVSKLPTDRMQFVHKDEMSSDYLNLTCGVPQGSILGPLLFLIYINDLASVSPSAATILFADDTNAIYRDKSYSNLQNIINQDLKLLSRWFRENKLFLNTSKTKFIIFHTRYNLPPRDFRITLDGVDLERVTNCKFLGVIIQENLSWSDHINYVANKVSKVNGILARLKHQLPAHIMRIIYNSLFRSHLTYGICVWGGAPNTLLNRLIKLQKKAIRHVCGAKYNAHTEPLFKKINSLRLPDCFQLQCSKLMYKKKLNILHTYHASKIKTNAEIRSKSTRQDYDVFLHRSTIFQKINTINYKVGISWNSLPAEIKELEVLEPTFSKKVKQYLLSQYSDTCIINNCYICGS